MSKQLAESDRNDMTKDNEVARNAKVSTGAQESEIVEEESDKTEEYDASLDMPIALRKGTRSCTKYPMHSFLS